MNKTLVIYLHLRKCLFDTDFYSWYNISNDRLFLKFKSRRQVNLESFWSFLFYFLLSVKIWRERRQKNKCFLIIHDVFLVFVFKAIFLRGTQEICVFRFSISLLFVGSTVRMRSFFSELWSILINGFLIVEFQRVFPRSFSPWFTAFVFHSFIRKIRQKVQNWYIYSSLARRISSNSFYFTRKKYIYLTIIVSNIQLIWYNSKNNLWRFNYWSKIEQITHWRRLQHNHFFVQYDQYVFVIHWLFSSLSEWHPLISLSNRFQFVLQRKLSTEKLPPKKSSRSNLILFD